MLNQQHSVSQLTCFRSSLLRAISAALSSLLIADRLFTAALAPELLSPPPAPDHPSSSVSQSVGRDVLICGVPIREGGADDDGMDATEEGDLVIAGSWRVLARGAGAGDDFWVLRFGMRAGAGAGVVAGVSSKVSPHAMSIVGSWKTL